MKVLLLGGSGQLGRALQETIPDGVACRAPGHAALELTDHAALRRAITDSAPRVIINAAAYTVVDRAEDEPERAFAVNADAAGKVAEAAAACGARLLHVSTDYVFDGRSRHPYAPGAATRPLSVYGASKREGERRVLAAHPAATVLRTAWLYAAGGGNFVEAVLARLAAGTPLRVVDDQVGAPTWARSLAAAVWRLATSDGARGVLHWTDAGETSRYGFAVAIQQEALACGLLSAPATIMPVPTADYPTAAVRPRYSVLDCSTCEALTGLARRPWRDALREMLAGSGAAGMARGAMQ